LYAIDPHVVPPVDDTNAVTTGYLFLDEAYTPPADLIRFLEAGDAPVYVGFGSMSSSDPMRTIHLIAEALAKVGRRGVLARGWSGADHITVPDHIYLLDKTSHTWLFPHMAAVVHHGGAGTTAAGLRAGKPTLIVPHMADQPYWGRRIHELGVGVKPIPRHQLTLDTLTKRLKTLLTDSDIQTRAVALGDQIRADDGVANAVNWIQAFISRLH
jgi:UDP:flavonoid glycosyltransferase YjiC (YdhE family)